MIIGIVVDTTLDSNDGFQQHVLAVGEELAKNHEVHYLTGQTDSRNNLIGQIHSMAKNFSIKINGNRVSTALPIKKSAATKIIDKFNFDVLYVQSPYSPFMAGKVILAANKQGIPSVGMFHITGNSAFERTSMKLLKVLQFRSIRKIHKMLCTSSAAEATAKTGYGYKNTAILPNPVDVKSYASAKPIINQGFSQTVFFLGRHVERKGGLQLMRAIKVLRDRNQLKDRLFLIGGDGPLRPKLEDYVKEHSLDDNVRFIGYLSEEDKRSYLKGSDIAIYPATGGESFGIVLIEAMASDKPVVLGGDNDGYRTVLKTGHNQLFNPEEPEEIADSILYFDDPANVLKATSWQRSEINQYSTAVVTKKLEEHLLDATKESKKH